MTLAELAPQVEPASLAGDRCLPVRLHLRDLVPGGGLRRGATVAVTGADGSVSLALALMAGPSAEGCWCALVGMPEVGLLAAAQLGVDLRRLALVPSPGSSWAAVAAALVDSFDVVAVSLSERVRAVDARRLVSRARQRGAVLLTLGARWPEAPDTVLEVVGGAWFGLEDGHGFLERRRLEVRAGGRGAAARALKVPVWLPGEPDEIEHFQGARA